MGFVVFASGLVWCKLRVGVSPEYLPVWLPETLVVGLGLGLTFPVLTAAAVSSLHPKRFAVGSPVNQTARQVGGALGVAVLVAILGSPTSRIEALASFRRLWNFGASNSSRPCGPPKSWTGQARSLPPRPAAAWSSTSLAPPDHQVA